jgi:hypothetical protein
VKESSNAAIRPSRHIAPPHEVGRFVSKAARWLENATRNKDARIDTRSSHIFVCKSNGRMGKHCSGKDEGDPAVGLLSHHAR